MTQLRFGRLFVLFCMGLAAACTSGTDGGSAGNAEINLWIGNDIDDDGVGDPGATSGELGFNVDRVDYRVTCGGNAPGTYPIPPANTDGTPYQYDDSADFTGQFEVVDGRDPPIWQALEDLPPGLCTISLWVFDGDDLVCSGTQTMGIIEDGAPPTKFDIVLVCSLSIDTPDGGADVDGRFDFITGNLCPKIYTLNAIHTEVDPTSASTEIQYRAKDPDNQCGANCDPCTPDFSTNPPTCPPTTPDPGLTCTLLAPGGNFALLQDAPGGIPPAGLPIGPRVPVNLNVFGEAVGGPGFILPGIDIEYLCDTGTPGTTTIVLQCTDGDIECNKTQTLDIICPGANLCDGTATCLGNLDCGATGICTGGFCEAVACPSDQCNDAGTCNAGDGACSAQIPLTGTSCTDNGLDGLCDAGTCVASGCMGDDALCTTASACTDKTCLSSGACSTEININEGGACDDESSGDCSALTSCPGTCGDSVSGTPDGICTATGCTSDASCQPSDPCQASSCNLATGVCAAAQPGNPGATCEVSAGVPGTCGTGTALGTCVGLCDGVNCTPANSCQTSTCNPLDGTCSAPTGLPDGDACVATNGEAGVCQNVTCLIDFAVSGEFRAYNNLLPAEGTPAQCGGAIPAGLPVGECTTPDLCTVPGSTLCQGRDWRPNCTKVIPTGTMLFDDDDAGNVTMTGTVLNDFVIDAAIDLNADCSQIANVTITTTSTTDVDGSGSGSVAAGQTLVLDTVTAPDPPATTSVFNVTYVGAGNVNCSVTGGSPLILCPLANLMAGDNALPQPGDPLARLWPNIEFIDNGGTLTWQFAGGKTVATGWSLNAPLDLASAGTQFIFFEGSEQ